MSLIHYHEELNPAQLEAVEFTEGSLLVIAGAGSGKTRTLTYRVARLVEQGITPRSILLLTFTRRAAQEMVRRATALLDERCAAVAGGTFHSFSHAVLRRYGPAIGLRPDFTIMDRGDSEDLVSMLVKEMGFSVKYRMFPKKGTLINLFSQVVNRNTALEDIIDADYPHLSYLTDAFYRLHEAFHERKQAHGYMDYDDLLLEMRRLLQEQEAIRQKLSAEHRYIMVDEYQDTNQIQADIIRLLAASHDNVMVVGDDSQSIYAFRGANFRNIMDFPKRFPGARIVKLEENFRSVQPILDFTNAVISRAREKYSKTLFTRSKGGASPILVAADSENRQSRFVVEEVLAQNRAGIPLHQIAVLFRAGFHSFDLEIELAREGIPFVKVGGFKFMESAHIKDLLAHMRVMVNPDDRISWYRVLMLIPKIGPKAAQSLFEAIGKASRQGGGFQDITPKPAYADGINRLQALYAGIGEQTDDVAAVGTALLDYYAPLLKQKYDDHPKRLRDLEHLIGIMQRYKRLKQFITDMVLEPPNVAMEGNLSTAERHFDHLTLSTIHSAKGLEWHTVFIISALEGRFPSLRAMQNQEEMEEELRLMYVAATRARENLFFCYPQEVYDRFSQTVMGGPSRFIQGFSEDLLATRYTD